MQIYIYIYILFKSALILNHLFIIIIIIQLNFIFYLIDNDETSDIRNAVPDPILLIKFSA